MTRWMLLGWWCVSACGGGATAVDAGSVDAPPALLYHGFLSLERWVRADPHADYTMTGLAVFHRGETMPRYADVDEYCGYAEGFWTETGTLPPSFGTIHMETAGLGSSSLYKQRMIWCCFAGAPGSAAIPAAALAHLIPSTDVSTTNFYFGGLSHRRITLGSIDIDVATWNGQAARVRIE